MKNKPETLKAYYLKNKDKIQEYSRHYSRKRSFGITQQEYLQLLVDQEACCAICSTPQAELKIALCVDHDHTTGKIRGILCTYCNLMLGRAQDDINLLKATILYLEKNNGTNNQIKA